MPSGNDSVFQCARPARSFTEYDGPVPFRGRTAPSRNSRSADGRAIKCAAYSTSLARSLRAARATALVPTEPKRLEYLPDGVDHPRGDGTHSSTTGKAAGLN